MAAELLLDTGAFVALVDRSETRHTDCVAALEGWEGPIVTSEAVLTETLYLVGPRWNAQQVCLEFFARGAFLLVPSSQHSLRRAAALMQKFQDVPMDFADATLVALAEVFEIRTVLSLDRRGFGVYRSALGDGFRLVPAK